MKLSHVVSDKYRKMYLCKGQNGPARSVLHSSDGFLAKLSKEADFIFKMTSPAGQFWHVVLLCFSLVEIETCMSTGIAK